MNTFGIYSINRSTFNVGGTFGLYYPKGVRDIIYTAMKLNNLTFNVSGYIPAASIVSGSVRMALWSTILVTVFCIGEPHADEGVIIKDWYYEARNTALSQIVRGVFEAFVPFGIVANIALDVAATPINVFHSRIFGLELESTIAEGRWVSRPYEAPNYLPLFAPLYLV